MHASVWLWRELNDINSSRLTLEVCQQDPTVSVRWWHLLCWGLTPAPMEYERDIEKYICVRVRVLPRISELHHKSVYCTCPWIHACIWWFFFFFFISVKITCNACFCQCYESTWCVFSVELLCVVNTRSFVCVCVYTYVLLQCKQSKGWMCIECEILVSGSECLNTHTSFPVVYLSTACWSVVYFYWRHVST